MPYIGQGLTEGRRRLHNFVATSNQTTFTATYDVGYIDVYQNGILLTSTDYTATNGTTVVLAVGASSSDEITIIAHQIFSITDTVSAITGGTFGGNVDVTGNITTTGSLRGPSSFTIDPATHGDNTGTVVIAGDLTVNGTTTTINSTTLTVDDKNLILASGTSNSSTADGSGLTIDLGSDGTATMVYTHATTSFNFNKPVEVAGTVTADVITGGTTNFDIKQSTADGSDNKRTRIGGGGDVINTRGAFIELHGNEHTSTGKAIINAGNVTGGEISLRTGGSENVVIAKNGNVGIGTPSPDTKLHAYTTSGNTYAKLESNANNSRSALLPWAKKSDGSTIRGYVGVTGDANKMEIATTTNDSIHFYTNNNPTNNGIFLKASGDVGIGTTNPSALQQNYIDSGSLNLGLRLTQNNSGQGIWMEFQPGNNTDDWQVGANNAGFAIYNATDSRYDITIDNTGNVGIGDSSPTSRLSISKDSARTTDFENMLKITHTSSGTTGVGFGSAIYFLGERNNGVVQGMGRLIFDAEVNSGSDISSGFSVQTATAGSPSEKFRITHDGNVGIGTSGPVASGYDTGSTKLSVMSTTLNNATSGYLELSSRANTNGYNAGAIQFNNFENANTAGSGVQNRTVGQIRTVIATTDSNAGDDSGGTMQFWTKPEAGSLARTMVIHSSGNVGIGEDNPLGKLHVKTADSGATADASADELVIEGSANAGMSILSGATSTGSIYFGDSGTNWDGYIAYSQNERKMTFGTAAGGGSVNIDSSGNVGIGTAPAEKLDVNGIIQTKTAVGTHPAMRFMEGSNTRAYLGAGDWAVNGLADDDFGIASSYTGDFAIATAFVNRFHITNAGNIGIGQTNPDAKIHISATRPHIDIEDTAAGARAKFGAGYANAYIATTHSGGDIFFKNGVGGSDFPHSSGTNLAIIGANGYLKTYGNTFHIHAGQGSLGHANEFQFLTTEVVPGTSGSWYDVCYVSHSPNLKFHGLSVQSNNASYGGARYHGALMGTYGSVACYQEHKRVTAMNGGDVTDINYRYLNSGASSGSYRLQVQLSFTGGNHRVYTCVYGNATAELSKDGY